VTWDRHVLLDGNNTFRAITGDALGNLYVVGSSQNGVSGLFSKYDTVGNLIWSRDFQVPGGANDLSDVSVDRLGNIFISGHTGGDLGGPNLGITDAFVQKRNAEGEVVWTRQFGGSGLDYAPAVLADGTGNVIVAGALGRYDGVSHSHSSIVRKYHADGAIMWQRSIAAGDTVLLALAADVDGNVYAAGNTKGSLVGVNGGNNDAFLRKYTLAGDVLWTLQHGTARSESYGSIAVDSRGRIAVSGQLDRDGWVSVFSEHAVPEPQGLMLVALAAIPLLNARQPRHRAAASTA
jgi:hypothetical protein